MLMNGYKKYFLIKESSNILSIFILIIMKNVRDKDINL